jgi:branched-chain amino acid transport system substrate-binding protein
VRASKLLAGLAALTLVFAACGGDDDDDASTEEEVDLPDGTPLVIGQIEAQTGVAGATGEITTSEDTLAAWAKYTNANGGINGHPVEIKVIDTKSDPAQSIAAVRDLVESEKVIAIVGSGDANQGTYADYLGQKKVPFIGGAIYTTETFAKPMFYAVGTTVVSTVWGETYAAKNTGKVKKLASLLCSNSTACSGARGLVLAGAKDNGIEVVFDQTADATATSYTPQCLAMKASGAESVLPFVNNELLARDCARQNYKPIWLGSETSITPDQLEATPDFEGLVGPTSVFPWFQEFPATKGFFEGMKKYAPEYMPGGDKYGTTGQTKSYAWASGEVFKKAIENANIAADATATSADVVRGLSMFKGETLGGASMPLTYNDGSVPNPQIKCFFLYEVKDGEYVVTGSEDKLEFSCQP